MENNYLVEAIEALALQFGLVVDWSSQNVLPYLEELSARIISHEIGMSIFWIAFVVSLTAIFVISGLIFYRLAVKSAEKSRDEYVYEEWYEIGLGYAAIFLWIVSAVGAMVMFVSVPVNIIHIMECINIPEKVVIDVFRGVCN